VEGPSARDTGENLASIVYTALSELDIGAKLLQLLGTMPINNLAIAEILFGICLKPILIRRCSRQACYEIPRRGKLSVRCLAHILNLIVKEFLGINNFYTVGVISTDISMGSVDFTDMNMNTVFFS
jgi:hypothetical protein